MQHTDYIVLYVIVPFIVRDIQDNHTKYIIYIHYTVLYVLMVVKHMEGTTYVYHTVLYVPMIVKDIEDNHTTYFLCYTLCLQNDQGHRR